MKYEDKLVQLENFLPFRKRHLYQKQKELQTSKIEDQITTTTTTTTQNKEVDITPSDVTIFPVTETTEVIMKVDLKTEEEIKKEEVITTSTTTITSSNLVEDIKVELPPIKLDKEEIKSPLEELQRSEEKEIFKEQQIHINNVEENDQTKYCICREKYNPNLWMIACDICNEWFHGKCVHVTSLQARKIKLYVCPNCSTENLKTIFKKQKKKTKKELENGIENGKQETKKRLISPDCDAHSKRKKKRLQK